mgnify:CR=1 FL=1
MCFNEWKTEVLFMLGYEANKDYINKAYPFEDIVERFPDLDLEPSYKANLTVEQYCKRFELLRDLYISECFPGSE